MNLYEKLLAIQCAIDSFVKDNTVGEGKQAYKAVSSEQVLDKVRPLLNDYKLLLIPRVKAARVREGQTTGGTTRYFTEIDFAMIWHDVESGEELSVDWYGQGVDLAGEKGVGKANTYAEKYFIMKFFHVPTPADDPDKSTRTKTGELAQSGTQAAAETADMQRRAVRQMLSDIYGGDEAKMRTAIKVMTASKSRGLEGVESVDALRDAALAVVYGRLKAEYTKRMGKEYVYRPEGEEGAEE